jgi:membrane-associated protein
MADPLGRFRPMDWILKFLDVILHLNLYIGQFAGSYGSWIYALLFLIIFCETGLVVTPFLPGDALLFTVGTLTAENGALSLPLIGERLFSNPRSRIFNRRHLNQTHAFFERHGAKTIMLSRFLPLIRTFAPFVAGMSSMSYKKFFLYNVVGAFVWVFGIVLLGHFFGNLPYVQKNYSLVILAIIVISMIPPGVEILRAWLGRSKAKV